MDESAFQQPTPEQLSAFVQGDPIAKDEIAHLLWPQLTRWAWRHYKNLPADEVQSVVNEALAEIFRRHERYDPSRASFTTYAIHLIKLRLTSLYQALKRIKEFQDSLQEGRENLLPPAYNKVDAAKVDLRIERDQFFSAAMKRLDGTEKDFLRLMLQGEKRQEAFGAILARNTTVNHEAQEVKNMKARLLRKLQATAHDLGYEAKDLLNI
jgi:hypothetical protein